MCLHYFNLICKERAGAGMMLFFLIFSALPATFSVWLRPTDITAVSQGGMCVDLGTFLVPGNNVMRTIHGVGEMMTQMVLSRGSIFPMSVPDIQPSLHPSKQGSPIDHEDVTVMDTKLKIIEILQVRAKWEGSNKHLPVPVGLMS